MTPTEPNKTDETYELIDRIAESKKGRQPRPLHPTFYSTLGSTTNREQERHAIRHSKKHRITCRTDKANRIKRQVKTIRMRNSVDKTISQILKFPSLYTLAARDLHQAGVEGTNVK